MTENEFAQQEEIRRISEAKVNASKAHSYNNPAALTEAEAAASEAYRIVKPLIEMKHNHIIKEQELQANLTSLMNNIEANTRQLDEVKNQLSELVKLRSVNAAKEAVALDKLIAVL